MKAPPEVRLTWADAVMILAVMAVWVLLGYGIGSTFGQP